ncbi:hypothetical protein QYE76_034219 [Lolium multiflorum]|uniref:No apical meristem-associated C-terminal domain-containing protein n=1 Tax=Lolium multiflorum TaxID=4521 RepID=A0AAD8QX98_LOLMU|nr:hypothetical protein QYE76_034219 [Lolium multiflorum]
MEMSRNEGVLSHRWNLIKAACSKFHGYYEKIKAWKESDKTMVDWDGEDGSVDPAGASTGRPIGNNKAKAERNAVPVLAAMDASIEKMITSFSVENKEAADQAAVVWKAILDKQDMKIELERERVEAAKMEAHAAAMKATNEAMQLSLAKMSQESKILMADMEKMSQESKILMPGSTLGHAKTATRRDARKDADIGIVLVHPAHDASELATVHTSSPTSYLTI